MLLNCLVYVLSQTWNFELPRSAIFGFRGLQKWEGSVFAAGNQSDCSFATIPSSYVCYWRIQDLWNKMGTFSEKIHVFCNKAHSLLESKWHCLPRVAMSSSSSILPLYNSQDSISDLFSSPRTLPNVKIRDN